MSIFSETSRSLSDLGKTIKNAAQDYAGIAKHAYDIKNKENEIEKNHIEIGKYIIEKINAGEKNLDLKDDKIIGHINTINRLHDSIRRKKKEIEKLKKKPVD